MPHVVFSIFELGIGQWSLRPIGAGLGLRQAHTEQGLEQLAQGNGRGQAHEPGAALGVENVLW